MSVTFEAAAEEWGTETGMTGLHKAPVDELGNTDKDDKDPDNLGKAVDVADKVDEDFACVAVLAPILIVAGAEIKSGTLVFIGGTMAGTLSNLGEEETKVGVQTGDNPKLPV